MPLTIGPNGEWVYTEDPTYPAQAAPANNPPGLLSEQPAQAPTNTSAIQALYQQNLGRAADAEGLNYWANSGLTPEQISASMQQSDEYRARQTPAPSFGAQAANPFGATTTQAQPTSAPVQTTSAPPRINYYDTPTFDPNAPGPRTYWVSDRLGFSESPAVTGGLSALSVRDPVTGSVNSQSVLSSPASMLEYLQRIAPDLTLEDLQGLQAGREAVFRNFGVQSNPAVDKVVDFDALSRGQLGTDFNWTYDTNVGSKGPAALGQLQRAQELAQRYGIQGANTGLIGYDIPDYYGGAIGDEPGGIRTYSPFEDLGISPDAYTDHTLNQGSIRLTDNGWERTEKPQLDSVRQLYRDVLGREPDAQGANYWRNSGLTLDQIAQEMAKTPEGRANPNAAAAAAALAPQPLQQTSSPFAANVAQLEKRQNEVPGAQSPFTTQTIADGQDVAGVQPATSGVDPSLFINRLSAQLGRLDEQELAPFQSQLASAIREFPNRPRGDINYNFQQIVGTSADDQGLNTGTFESSGGAPNIPGLSDREAAYATFLVNSNASVRGTTPANAPLKLLDAGFSADDVRNILGTLGVGESAGSIDEAIADAAARDFMKQTGLKPDTGSFGSFIKDAFNSPVGGFILAGLTGGLGGLGAIGGTLSGGALTGAGASALGGAAIGGLGAGLGGNNIAKGALLGGLGGGLAGSGFGNATLGNAGGAALRGGLLGGVNSAVSGGDVLQGLLGGAVQGGVSSGLSQLGNAVRGGLLGNSFAGDIDFNDIEPNSFPTQEGDTFNDQTNYLEFTADNLRATAEAIVNNPDSTPLQIERAIADYQRAVDLGNMAGLLGTDGAYRVEIRGVGNSGGSGFTFVPSAVRPQAPTSPLARTEFGDYFDPTSGAYRVDITGANTEQEEVTPLPGLLSSGGAGGSTQVPTVAQPSRPTLPVIPPVGVGGPGGGGGAGGASSVGQTTRPTTPTTPTTPTGPSLSDLIKLIALLGGGAALGGSGGGGGGGSGGGSTSQTRYRFNPVVSQYPGDLSKYGETDIGDFKFYRPGLLTD